jgi:hypothetical protein
MMDEDILNQFDKLQESHSDVQIDRKQQVSAQYQIKY